VQTTLTRPNGSYLFNNIDLGTYTVSELLLAGAPRASFSSAPIHITRGMLVNHVDFPDAPPPGGPIRLRPRPTAAAQSAVHQRSVRW
jgi:hypothetical protein